MKIVVLAGGTSAERDVSLSTGGMIYRALKQRGHQAILLDVYLGYEKDPENIFEVKEDWAARAGSVGEKAPDPKELQRQRSDGGKSFFGPNVLKICRSADCVFLALHGGSGEDGKIQACFELMGIPYTGADPVGSALAMDKGITKDIFKAYGIPAPEGIRMKKGEQEGERIPFPCVVKACRSGSSVGVCMAGNEEEYLEAKKEAFRYDDEVIIERYIPGREFSVGVLDGRALPVIEMAPREGFYDYKNKYQAGGTVETCPALLSSEQTARLQALAEKVFRVLRLKNYARMDFRMNEAGDFFCLEANTLPGMTPISLLPQEAAAAGIDFPGLCQRILECALRGDQEERGGENGFDDQ